MPSSVSSFRSSPADSVGSSPVIGNPVDHIAIPATVAGDTPLSVSLHWYETEKAALQEQRRDRPQIAFELRILDEAFSALTGRTQALDPRPNDKGGTFVFTVRPSGGKPEAYRAVFTRDPHSLEELGHLEVVRMDGTPVVKIGNADEHMSNSSVRSTSPANSSTSGKSESPDAGSGRPREHHFANLLRRRLNESAGGSAPEGEPGDAARRSPPAPAIRTPDKAPAGELKRQAVEPLEKVGDNKRSKQAGEMGERLSPSAGGPAASSGISPVDAASERAQVTLSPITPLANKKELREYAASLKEEVNRWAAGRQLTEKQKARVHDTGVILEMLLDPQDKSYEEDFTVLVNKAEDRVAGIAVIQNVDNGPPFIARWVTNPDFPGNGTKFLQHLEEMSLNKEGNDWPGFIDLIPLTDNAIEVFRKMGFVRGDSEGDAEDPELLEKEPASEHAAMHRHPSHEGSANCPQELAAQKGLSKEASASP